MRIADIRSFFEFTNLHLACYEDKLHINLSLSNSDFISNI